MREGTYQPKLRSDNLLRYFKCEKLKFKCGKWNGCFERDT